MKRDTTTALRTFIARFEPKHQALIRSVRKGLQRTFPGACELVYDNYNFFVIGFSATERPSDAVVSIAAGANGVGVCFIQGARLADPKKVLLGSGRQTRFIRVESAAVLARPEVRSLLAAARAQSKVRFSSSRSRQVIIRSVSAKQRPRRRES